MRLVELDALVTFIKDWGQNQPVSCLEIGYELSAFRWGGRYTLLSELLLRVVRGLFGDS